MIEERLKCILHLVALETKVKAHVSYVGYKSLYNELNLKYRIEVFERDTIKTYEREVAIPNSEIDNLNSIYFRIRENLLNY